MSGDRGAAIHAVDALCPRCGAEHASDQRFCLECGRPLPQVQGRIPSWRRRWIRYLGWYPGDWLWPALGLLVVAIAGAAVATAISHQRDATRMHVITALSPLATTTTAAEPNGQEVWPPGETGWTVVIVSVPKTGGEGPATATATRAVKAGLPSVGVLDSSRYASLQPGYFVVWSGIYDGQDEANAAVQNARQAGFGGAYTRQIAG